VVSNLTLRNG